jgi:hypothetical protein
LVFVSFTARKPATKQDKRHLNPFLDLVNLFLDMVNLLVLLILTLGKKFIIPIAFLVSLSYILMLLSGLIVNCDFKLPY